MGQLGEPAGGVVRAAHFESRKGGICSRGGRRSGRINPLRVGDCYGMWKREYVMERASDLSPRASGCPRVCVGGMGGGGRIKFRDQPKSTSGEDAGDVVFSHGRHQSGTKEGKDEGGTVCLRGRPDRVTLF